MKKNTISIFLSNKIAFASFLYAVMVVVLHAYCATIFGFAENSGNWAERAAYYFQNIFSQDFTRCAIPTFFIISGYLFFVKVETQKDIFKNIYKRIFTLVVPFVIWNIVYFVYTYFVDMYPQGVSFEQYLALEPGVLNLFIKIFRIVFLFEYSMISWYLFVLFGFVVLTPILYYTLKNKNVAIVTLILFLIVGFFEPVPLMRGKNYTMFFFYLGAFVSKYANDYVSKKRTYRELIPYIGLFVVSQIMVYIYGFYSHMEGYISRFVFEILISVSIWFLLDIIPEIKLKNFYQYSFAIYLTHVIVLSLFKLLAKETALGQMGPWVATAFYVIISALGVIIPIKLFSFIKNVSPKLNSILTGGR